MLHAVGRTEFDHAVVMVRDRLDALAPHFRARAFTSAGRRCTTWGRAIA